MKRSFLQIGLNFFSFGTRNDEYPFRNAEVAELVDALDSKSSEA